MTTPDVYGGAAVTTQNIIREVGKTTTSDVAGAGTFTADVGDVYDIWFGIDSDDDDAEPYGGYMRYTVPCKEEPSAEFQVVDDAVATDLTVTMVDPEDGNVVSSSDLLDVDAGDVLTARTTWTGAFEEDFGNRWCEDQEGVQNVIVITYNTSQYDDIFPTALSGGRLPAANVNINRLLSATAGYTDATYYAPVLRSNVPWDFNVVFDADNSVDPDGGISNVTIRLYDVNWYEDNDVTPAEFKCGIMDEDANEVGAAAADSLTVTITDD